MATDRARDLRNELADVKALLQSRIESLAHTLAPGGKRLGIYYFARNPTRKDDNPNSFYVVVSGSKVGKWADEATGDGAAVSKNGLHRGDPLGLIGYVYGLDFRGSMDWARDWLGMARNDPQAIVKAHVAVQRHHVNDDAREADLLERKRKQAFALWLKGKEGLAGTPVETYLATRGIDLAKLKRAPRAIRCLGRKHLESGLFLPCMLAQMTGPTESVYAVHCTFLKPDGSGKADVTPARKIWPSFKGAAIRLARGETGLTPGEAAKQGLLDTLVLCEGVEDGLSIALACPEYRVWAAGSIGNLAHIVLPTCCADVIIAADNDWGKPQAQKQLETAIAALSAQGRPVRVARSHIGKDANDALRAGSAWSPHAA